VKVNKIMQRKTFKFFTHPSIKRWFTRSNLTYFDAPLD